MLLSDHVETIQALPKCRKVLYHAPIRSRGNYSSLTQMQKSIVPCSYQITWKLFKPYPNVEKYCTMLLSDHVETIQALPKCRKVLYHAPMLFLPKCRKVLYHAPIRSRGNYSSLTQMQKSIVPCSYQITWKLFSLTQMQKSIYHAPIPWKLFKPYPPIRSRGNYSALPKCRKVLYHAQMYQITWKLFKPYPNVEKYCTMLLSDHVETIQPYPNVEKYCTMLLSDHVETIQPYPNVEKYCTMLLSDHVETIQALPKCRKVLYHAPIRSRGNYSSLTPRDLIGAWYNTFLHLGKT